MTLTRKIFDLPQLHRVAIGLDPFFDILSKQMANADSGYPPYNIVELDDTTSRIEIALAGFNPADVSITVDGRVLSVEGSNNGDTDGQYVHKGISGRAFSRTFTLGEFVEVKSASFKYGVLNIQLEKVVPEDKKPKSIPILNQD